MMKNKSECELCLKGLPGDVLLGFLAAIGTLHTVTRESPSSDWRLAWRIRNGRWSPFLICNHALAEERLVELLMPPLKAVSSVQALHFAKNLKVSSGDFRHVSREAYEIATPKNRLSADFIASFGCDALRTSHREDTIQDTALRTMSGTGHQHFIGTMKELVQRTDSDHLYTSLFEQWRYLDEKLGMRWDPFEDRRHALRWKAPDKDSAKTMRGANRLAVEALPLFPTAPSKNTLHTTGFSQNKDTGVCITWPLWENPLRLDTIRSLLSLAELQNLQPDRDFLQSMGIVEIYRSRRITQGKYRNFTQSFPA